MRSAVVFAVLVGCTGPTTVVKERTVVVNQPGANQLIPVGDDDPAVEHDAVPFTSGAAIPILGGGLEALPDGRLAVVDPENGMLYITSFSGTSRQVHTEVDLGAGSVPFRMAAGTERVWVTLREAGDLVAVNPDSGEITHRVAVCTAPRGVLLDGFSVWVACATGELVEVDTGSGEILASFQLEPDLRDVVRDGDYLAVSRFRAAQVLWVEPETGAIVSRNEPEAVLRTGFEGQLEPFEPAVAWRMRSVGGGGVALGHQRAMAGDIPEVVGGSGEQPVYGQPTGCTSLVHSVMSTLSMEGGRWSSFAIQDPLPVDLRVAGDRVEILSAASNETYPETIRRMNAGCDQSGTFTTGTGTAVAFVDTAAGRVVLSRAPLALHMAGGDLRDALLLADRADDITGFTRFHEDPAFGVACASCHPEGHDDGRVWNFRTRGKRRTQTLAVGLASLDHLHWDGEFDSMDTLLSDVLVERMSGGTAVLTPQEPSQIVRFLDRTPPLRGAHRADEQVTRGAELFWSDAAGCAECHNGPAYSDGRLVNVGTGIPARTPSLLGVGQREVWMHDGCATTLHERFDEDCGGGDLHGRTSHLDDADIDALVAYLGTL
ncbi:MAG: cytochrome c553 [Myxococcota bacterium]|jgi:cytochrome c553